LVALFPSCFSELGCELEKSQGIRDAAEAWVGARDYAKPKLLLFESCLPVATDGSRRIKLCFMYLFFIFVQKWFRQLILGYNRGNIV
jgi:hypothetical protein